MRIRAVTPVITESFGPMIMEEFERVARPDTELSNVFLKSGPASVESAYDEAVAVPDVIARVREAADDDMAIGALIEDCHELSHVLPEAYSLTKMAIASYINGMKCYIKSGEIQHEEFHDFQAWWGRGMQYVSFVKE